MMAPFYLSDNIVLYPIYNNLTISQNLPAFAISLGEERIMRNMLTVVFKFIARLIAIFLAVLTIVATISVLLLLSIDHTILNPHTSKQAFIKNKVYERLPAVTAGEFSLVKGLFADQCNKTSQACPIETTTLLNSLSTKQWEALVIHLLPEDELQTVIESTLDEVISYFRGETDSVQIPLASLKARLTGQSGEELTKLLLSSQPACTAEQQVQIKVVDLNSTGVPLITCAATGELQLQLSAEVQRRLKIISAELPETVIIIKRPSLSMPPGLRSFLGEDWQAALQKLNMGLSNAPLLPFALLILLALFSVRSLRGWMRWWSIPIFIAGLVTLIFGTLLFFMFDQLWMKYILPTLPLLFASGFGQVTQDVARTLTNDLAKRVLLQAGVLSLLALATLYASSFLKPPPDPSLPPLAQPGTPGGPVIHPSQQKKRKGW